MFSIYSQKESKTYKTLLVKNGFNLAEIPKLKYKGSKTIKLQLYIEVYMCKIGLVTPIHLKSLNTAKINVRGSKIILKLKHFDNLPIRMTFNFDSFTLILS